MKTASRLREDEGMRAIEVQRILERNGYFAPLDNDIQNQATHLIEKGEMTQAQADKWIRENEQTARERIVGQLAKGRDASGEFDAAGLTLTDDKIADRIRQNLTFDTVSGPLATDNTPQISNQIKVAAKFEREAEANLYVNLLCVEFLDFYTNERATAVNARIALLHEKLDEANRRLQRARQDEVVFRTSNSVALTATTDAAIGQAATLEVRRDDAEAELRAGDAAVTTLQGALAGMSETQTTTLPANENPEVRAMQAEVDAATIAFQAVKQSNVGENNDKYVTAKGRLDAAQRQLQDALHRSFTTTRLTSGLDDIRSKLDGALVQRNAAQQRLDVLDKQLAAQHVQLGNLPAAQARLADLHREIAISEQNVRDLETTVAREETYGIEHGRAGSITIVSQAHATPIVSGIAAQRGKLIVYGMVLALIFGVALVIGLDALDDSIRNAADVEKLTGLPVAGIIPEHLPDPVRSPRVALLEPMSPAAEAYRLLRTDLLFTAADKPFQSLLMATAKPGQGATTTLCNLAIVLAQSGKRVILVDADLRHPKLHRIFNTQNDIGLTAVLGERCSLEDALTPTEVENLTLLPAGPFVMNPSEILGSPRMLALHELLKANADYILFDTPAAIAFSDTSILSSFVDSTLMVVRASNVPRGTESQVRAMLNKARANVIGVVLNGVAPQEVDSVHYHGGSYPLLPAQSANGRNGNGAGMGALPQFSPVGRNDQELAIALPEAASSGESAEGATEPPLEERPIPQAVVEGASRRPSPGGYATLSGEAPTVGTFFDAPPGGTRMKPHQSLQLRVILLIVAAGIVLGSLVLLLSSGTAVK
jgi:capsular exopolysaccharide synthesis family protein